MFLGSLTIVSILTVAMTVTTVLANDIKIKVDGKQITSDVAPVIKDGRTLVPIRVVAEALGLEVEWDGENNVVKITEYDNEKNVVFSVSMGIDKTGISSTEGKGYLETPPTIIEGRTMLPLREISEMFGASVDWDGVTSTVMIKSKGSADTVVSDGTVTYFENFPTVPNAFATVSSSEKRITVVRDDSDVLIYTFDCSGVETDKPFYVLYATALSKEGFKNISGLKLDNTDVAYEYVAGGAGVRKRISYFEKDGIRVVYVQNGGGADNLDALIVSK